MVWCLQATSHHLSQIDLNLSPYGITEPQQVDLHLYMNLMADPLFLSLQSELVELSRAEKESKVAKFMAKEEAIMSKPLNPFTQPSTSAGAGEGRKGWLG